MDGHAVYRLPVTCTFLKLMMVVQVVLRTTTFGQENSTPQTTIDAPLMITNREHLLDLSVAVGQLLHDNLANCFTVVMSAGNNHTFMLHLKEYYLLREEEEENINSYKGMVYLAASGLKEEDDDIRALMIQSLRSLSPGFTCKVIVIDAIVLDQLYTLLSFLEEAQLYERPDTYVVLAGEGLQHARDILMDNVFRNTIHPIYLGKKQDVSFDDKEDEERRTQSGLIEVFTRCLYCGGGGNPQVISLGRWRLEEPSPHLDSDVFPDQFADFNGHLFKIVCMAWFPFTDFSRTSSQGGTIVYPMDSLDVRMLNAIAATLNFTYEMRVPWDNQWGTSTDSGNWTGIVGTLQYHKGDFSMMLSWIDNRLPVVDYSRIYGSEPLVMVTLKSAPLSQSFALVRPFTASLWALTIVSAIVAAMVLWCVQKVWSSISGEESLNFKESLLLTWAILLEDPPLRLPSNATAQMLIGWWWLYCMLVTITYRSSLIAHLTVPGKSSELNSLDDLLEAKTKEKWTWGYEPTYGSGWEWLKLNENPTVKEVFKGIKLLEFDDQMKRLLGGGHAFITWKYYIRAIIGSDYTDKRGYTPIHTAKEEFFNFGGYGWGFRKGAPFRKRIDVMKMRLIESGAINFWLDELIESFAIKSRIERRQKDNNNNNKNEEIDQPVATVKDGSETVLGMGHLQGVFYILIMGLFLGWISFLFEVCSGKSFRTKKVVIVD